MALTTKLANARLVEPHKAVEVAKPKSLEPWFKDPQFWGLGPDAFWYNHQIVGVRRMNEYRSMLVADDMGLGKTMEVLATFCIDIKQGKSRSLLVVAPKGLKSNWADSIEQFTRLDYVVVKGTRPKQAQLILEFDKITKPKILVMHYEQVNGYEDQLNSMGFDLVAFDEAHMLKNPDSIRTKACRGLTIRRKFPMTGSPMLNNVCDLWVLLDLVSPGQFDSYLKFQSQYAVLGGRGGKQVVGVKNYERLRLRVQNLMLQRKKEDVLDLPAVQYITRLAELGKEQRRIYDKIRTQLLVEYGDGTEAKIKNDDSAAGVVFGRLLQVCGTTAAIDPELGDHSEKLDLACDDAVQMVRDGHPVVAFTRYRGVQQAYVERLQKAMPGVPVYVLNGDTPTEDRIGRDGSITKLGRQGVVKRWSADDPCVMVCTYQVAGVGLNMTHARHGQRLDKLFVPDLNKQAVDRLNRIGADTTQPIQMFDYAVAGTVEHRVQKILRKKANDINTIMNYGSATREMLDLVMTEEREDQ